MLSWTSGVRILMLVAPDIGERVLAPRARSAGRAQICASERTPMFCAIDHCGKMPSDCRSPATSATGARDLAPAAPPRRRTKVASNRSVWPWPARPARPMISPCMRDQFRAVRLPVRADAHAHRRFAAGGAAAAARACARPRSTPPIAPISLVAVERLARRPSTTTLPSRITTMRSQWSSTSPRICEISMQLTPPSTERRHEAEQLPGGMRVERGGRLVQDDEARRLVGRR